MIFLYSKKDSLFYGLHTFALSFYLLTLFVISLLYTHPLWLGSLCLLTVAALISSGNLQQWLGYAKVTVPMIGIIMLINGLFVRQGATVLLRGPKVPVIGQIRITAEAILYGADMGLRLLVVISIFCLFTYTVQPDKFMKLFGSFGNKTVFVITLSMRLFPLMILDYRRITEIQRCRGIRYDADRWVDRAKAVFPVVSVLLLSSLERSFMQAESMYARGYGSGRRSISQRDHWRRRDSVMFYSTLPALILSIGFKVAGYGHYSFYPRLSDITPSAIVTLLPVVLLLMIPLMMEWGWRKWPTLRSLI